MEYVLSIYLCDVNYKEEEGKYFLKRGERSFIRCLEALLRSSFGDYLFFGD